MEHRDFLKVGDYRRRGRQLRAPPVTAVHAAHTHRIMHAYVRTHTKKETTTPVPCPTPAQHYYYRYTITTPSTALGPHPSHHCLAPFSPVVPRKDDQACPGGSWRGCLALAQDHTSKLSRPLRLLSRSHKSGGQRQAQTIIR